MEKLLLVGHCYRCELLPSIMVQIHRCLNICCTTAIVVFLLLLSCCVVTRKRRRFAQRVNPNVKPPLFGTAPPGYSLPFWNNNRFNQPTAQGGAGNTFGAGTSQGNNYTGGTEGPNPDQYPPPMTHAASNPPPYGKADANGPYAPVSTTCGLFLQFTNIITARRSTASGAYHCKFDCR